MLRDVLYPYDIDSMVETIHMSLTLPKAARQARMKRLREAILEHNVYRWAAKIIDGLCRIPPAHGR